MEISISLNDALATNALSSLVELGKIAASSQKEQIKSTADTQQFGIQTSGLQSLLSFIGTLITANLQETAKNTSSGSIMPILLGMLMGNNGFSPTKKTDSPSIVKDDSEKNTPENSENSEE